MTNLALERKIKAIKSGLSEKSDGELSDLVDSTRLTFEKQLTGDDRAIHLDLFESLHKEISFREHGEEGPNTLPYVHVDEALQTEIDGMDSKQLDKAIREGREKVLGADYRQAKTPEGLAASERLQAMVITQVSRGQQADLDAQAEQKVKDDAQFVRDEERRARQEANPEDFDL